MSNFPWSNNKCHIWEILIAPSGWVDVALISVAWKSLKSCFLRKKLFVRSPGKLCLEKCALAVGVGDATECAPHWLVSSVTHLCILVCDCLLGQGQALTRLCLSVTGAPGCLFRLKGTNCSVRVVCQNICTVDIHGLFNIALAFRASSKHRTSLIVFVTTTSSACHVNTLCLQDILGLFSPCLFSPVRKCHCCQTIHCH